jgi:hypothetical protein
MMWGNPPSSRLRRDTTARHAVGSGFPSKEGRSARWDQYGFAVLPHGERDVSAAMVFNQFGNGVLHGRSGPVGKGTFG